jgi:hypothetical protein
LGGLLKDFGMWEGMQANLPWEFAKTASVWTCWDWAWSQLCIFIIIKMKLFFCLTCR